jgi:hypothetical protein
MRVHPRIKRVFGAFCSDKEDPPRSGKAQSSFFENKAAKKLLVPKLSEAR